MPSGERERKSKAGLVDLLDRMQEHRCTANVLLLLPSNIDLFAVLAIVVEGAIPHHLFVDLLVKVWSVDSVVQHLGLPYMTQVDWMWHEDALEWQW